MSHLLIPLASFLREVPEQAVVKLGIQSFDNWALLSQLQDKVEDIRSREMSQHKTRRNWQKQAPSSLLLTKQKQSEDDCGVSQRHIY